MNCELCGKNTAIYDSEIEGTWMKVCQDCSKYGKTKKPANVKIIIKERKPEFQRPAEPEFMVIKGYGAIVKRAREKLGLKQDEMAKRLNERESLLHQIESEHFQPNIDLARKLERELKIKLLEEVKEDSAGNHSGAKSPTGNTLGDFLYKKLK